MRLDGKVAVVTGGGSGIGAATARLFAEAGARVAVIDRDGPAAEAVAAEIGGLARLSDVGDPGTVAADAAAIIAALGGIDVLVTAAGFSVGGTVETTDPADWDAVFRAHVGGTWLWAGQAVPSMRGRGGGAIVTVASQLALAGGRGNSAYIAAKGAVLSLTRTMALDFAADRIRVNAVVPGAIETPLLARSFRRAADPDAARAASEARHALKRLGQPEEVARAALYLASDASSFTTGAALPVEGGWLSA
ncbi:SDR family oxidoreductase [Methylobacterium frigidaeris]|uniref:Dihydroanticapsin 7-dehydrogenase n=1 Tax=Methylobacterium frigidaeris TaxID=2038277 RepID=A0AA37HGF2_9HYPH|nr:SDR family oxidoreductase [Methylobacterium frigidaeris]PIK68693.1 short-chain dehydrogenase [Methylobacterium frigidaeris]GJD65592.1 Dihydroanticapsin 7-dehydrogenase [Methylobacterium frigidaeris]